MLLKLQATSRGWVAARRGAAVDGPVGGASVAERIGCVDGLSVKEKRLTELSLSSGRKPYRQRKRLGSAIGKFRGEKIERLMEWWCVCMWL